MGDLITIRGQVSSKDIKQAPVRPTLIIGVGGSGGDVLLRVRKRFFEKYGSLAHFPIVSYMWIDTDLTEKEVGAGVFSEHIAFSPSEKIMATMPDTTIVTNDLNQYPHIKRWFYPGLTKLKTMTEGAGQIRAYSRLGFFHHYAEIRSGVENAARKVANVENVKTVQEKHHLQVDNALQVFVICSVAGGTGSGMFLDLAFLVKDIFRGNPPTTIGYMLMPGLFNPDETKIFANGYAALKELEHYSYENDFNVEWSDRVGRNVSAPPFSYAYLIDRINAAGQTIDFATRELVFNMVAESIFKDFTQSDFAGYKRGVRINLDQYLVNLFAFRHLNERAESIIEQKFITRFSSFGMASITVPADRIKMACAYKLAAEVVDHWGSLSNSSFNAAILTDVVLRDVLPRIRMYEGNFASQGAIEQRHDIQNFLIDDGRRQGRKIHHLIAQSMAETAREVREGIHEQKGMRLSHYLRAAIEKERAKLLKDRPDPQQWGDYSRAVHFNKEELAQLAGDLLRKEVGVIINEQHQSVGYAIELLRQVVNVLRDEHREYISNFERQRDRDLKRAEEGNRRLDHLLAEISRHESRSNWDGRKSTIISYDIKRFEEAAPGYLNALLLSQVHNAAKEVCEQIVAYIGLAERTESGDMLAEGLIGELYTLGGNLESLKQRFQTRYEHFRQKTTNELSLMLYDPGDIEASYIPRYLGLGEKAARQIESIGDQILAELKTSVIDLPALVRRQGIDKVEIQIRDLARKPFQHIRKDFDVLDTLWKKYPGEGERETQVRFAYDKAKFWLYGGKRERSYQILSEQHKIIVGVPKDCSDPIKLDEFRELLQQRIHLPGDPALSIQPLPDRSEIVFYSEVGGIPINWADSVAGMREKYLQKQGDGEELHTDANEIKFRDLVVLNDQERSDLEAAHECFLLGLIFGEIWPEHDNAGRVIYVWSEQVGVAGISRPMRLGIELRALAELVSKKWIRETLLARVRQHEAQVRNDLDWLARFNALVGWYYEEVYPPSRKPGPDGAEYTEQSNACRAVGRLMDSIKGIIEAQERSTPGTLAAFVESTKAYRTQLDQIAPLLIDGKRSLRIKQEEPLKTTAGSAFIRPAGPPS